MTLEIYTSLRNEIDQRLDKADMLVKAFPTNSSGLVAMTDDFRAAKNSFSLVFNELRVLNKHTSNKIKREYSIKKRNEKIKKNSSN